VQKVPEDDRYYDYRLLPPQVWSSLFNSYADFLNQFINTVWPEHKGERVIIVYKSKKSKKKNKKAKKRK